MLGLTRMRCLARSFPFCANRLVQKNLPRSVGALQKTPCYGQTHAFARGFATPVNIQQEDSNVNETQDEITKDALEPWIKSLESFANEPWLLDMPYDPLVKLRMSLALLYLLLLRLPRSDDREKQDQFRAVSCEHFLRYEFSSSCTFSNPPSCSKTLSFHPSQKLHGVDAPLRLSSKPFYICHPESPKIRLSGTNMPTCSGILENCGHCITLA